MKNKSYSAPLGMLTKKCYCHKCGERLVKHPKTRTLSPGDPDYKWYSRIVHTHLIGDVEVTEYVFKCPSCGNIIEYDEQCVIRKIQKKFNKKIITDEEVLNNRENLEDSIKRNTKILKVIVYLVAITLIGLAIFLKIKLGDNSLKFYF